MAIRRTTAPHLRPVADDGVDRSGDVETTLIARAIAGDGRAWTRLYQDHFQGLYTDLLYLVGEPAAAEELSQDTFAAALVSLRRFDSRASFSTWLRGVGHNLVRKHWRTKARRGRAYSRLGSGSPSSDPSADPEGHHVQDRQAEVLAAVLEELPDSLREVFVMRDVQGLSPEEIAARLRLRPGNVRVRCNRARKRIRAELARLGWIEEGGA